MGCAEVTLKIQRLSLADQEAIADAVAKGRAVEEEHLAALAAELAIARRQQAALVCFGIIAPVGVLSFGVIVWLVAPVRAATGWAVVVGWYGVAGTVSLLIRRNIWRPLVRAEEANLAAGGAVPPPPTPVASDWCEAWAAVLVITAAIRLMLDLVEVSLGPITYVLWSLLVWPIRSVVGKRRSLLSRKRGS